MLNFGYCDESSNAVPFSYDELSGQIKITSPVENFTYSDSDIVLNADLYIGGIEWEKGSHYIPYQNISCVYSLDGAEWQNMSLVSVDKGEPFSSLVNNYWYSVMWLNYTVLLQNVSEGSHYLKVDVKPDSIHSRDYSGEDKPLVYFNVIKQSSITELNDMLIIGLVIVTIATILAVIYVKKVRPNRVKHT